MEQTPKTDLILPEEENVLQLKLLPGGKDGNWLWNLNYSAVFLCRPKAQKMKNQFGAVIDVEEHNLMELHVDDKEPRGLCVCLFTNLNEENYTWVDSRLFSERFDLVCIRFEGFKDGTSY